MHLSLAQANPVRPSWCGRRGGWLLALLTLLAVPPLPAYDGLDQYEPREIEGWKVRVHRRLLQGRPTLAAETLAALTTQLENITRVVPASALAQLRQVPIWVELAHPRHACMCYHPSAAWLREHGMHPAKAGGIEIANATNFLSWIKHQPWMVLHELAHAHYHHSLQQAHQEIRAAYQRALASDTYEQVRHASGQTRRHYGLNNEQEFFAEATEAFFGRNDFYPFERAELREHDPLTFQLLRRLWGVNDPPPPAADRPS